MAVTSINVSDILGRIDGARKEIANQEDSIRQIADSISSLDGVWESPTKQVYVQNFLKSRAEMEKFNETQKSYFQMMQGFVDDCVSTDNAVRDLLKKIGL
jgi:uncharacterized protein YukE